MFKKILSMAVLALSALTIQAQAPTQLPLNPAIRHGQLANGLNYYILHNEEPKERANFYIAQKVGSTLETQDQLGLAHFLEHMAFNGTKNFPGKNMLNYLQGKGIRFGADINAYTAFDETVYNIDNVPTTDKALMDSVMLVLHDWSGSILLEESEINAERGVIEEEWRSRNNAMQRMYESILPQIYQEYQYQQMPIGKMEVVRNFPPEVLRAYYKKWYRPDQQGIVIVGDIDVDEIEAKVKALFSDIPMPENAAERLYPTVSDNEKPIYAYFTDKEMQFPLIMVSFKSDKIPFEMRNTDMAFVQTAVLQPLIESMINTRLSDYAKTAECDYAQASVNFGDFYVSKTKDAFDIQIIGKQNITDAYMDALGVVARACKTGFMESELVRARDEMLAMYDKLYNERNNTKSGTLAKEIIRHYIDNESDMGIETEYELIKSILPNIPVQVINQLAAMILTAENQVIVVGQPTVDGMEIVSEEIMVNGLNSALNAEYEAYVDEVITEPLIAKLPKPGKVKAEKAAAFGTTEFTLSNGAKVILKPTDFKSDEIKMTAFAKGGKQTYTAAQADNVLLMEDAYAMSKVGPFNMTRLEKYLAGKNVGVSYSVGRKYFTVDGHSTKKDLKTFMELVYAKFTSVTPDAETYNVQMDKLKPMLANQEKDANYNFSKHISSATYGNNPLFASVSVASIDAANYAEMVKMANASLSNAADYTFVFTGNVDAATLKPLLEQYIATLPSKGKPSAVNAVSSVVAVNGDVDDQFNFPMQVPGTMVYNRYGDNNVNWNIENSVMVEMVGEILSNIYTDTLREEEGGTYSPYAGSRLDPFTGDWNLFYVFQTNDQQQEKLRNRAHEELLKLLTNGADEVNFTKVKEAMAKQYEIKVRTNEYWDGNLMYYAEGFDAITNNKAAIDNLTLTKFNDFMKTLYNGKNRIQVVLHGVAE